MPTAPGLAEQLYLNVDLTGASPDNFIDQDTHQTRSDGQSILRPAFGKFFAKSMSVYALQASGTLTKMNSPSDYVFGQYDQEGSAAAGLDVYEVVIVKTPSPTGFVYLSYQAFGGTTQVNKPYIHSIVQNSGVNAAVDYANIQAKPETFYPTNHQHDIKDFYGFDRIVAAVNDLVNVFSAAHTAYNNGIVSYKDYQVYNAVANFKTTLNTATATIGSTIAAHIGNTGYSHTYTAAMVGLGNVQNYGFTATTVNGVPQPYYASPAFVKQAIASPPAATPTNHATLTNNPHGTTATQLNLGNVQNLDMSRTYTLGQNAFQSLLFSPANTTYLSNYVLVNALQEAQAAQVSQYLTAPSIAATSAGGNLYALNQQVTAIQSSITAVTDTLTTLSGVNTNISNRLATAVNTNRHFTMVDYNKALASGLKQILSFDYANSSLGYSVGVNGYWPLPPNIPGLYCWFDVDYGGNTVVTDSQNNPRLISLVDRSVNARVFAARTPAQGPYFGDSADVAAGSGIGISVGKVARFTPGNYLDQISGPSIVVRPGMTIFTLTRSSASGAPLTLLSEVSPTPKASIVVQGPNNRAITISTTDGWSPLRGPQNTSRANTATLLVSSISPEAEGYCWTGSSLPLTQAFPRGVDTPASTWASSTYASSPLTRMGTTDAQGTDAGEVSEVLIYNRQLSFAEVDAVIAYLRLANTNNRALTVDLSAQSLF